MHIILYTHRFCFLLQVKSFYLCNRITFNSLQFFFLQQSYMTSLSVLYFLFLFKFVFLFCSFASILSSFDLIILSLVSQNIKCSGSQVIYDLFIISYLKLCYPLKAMIYQTFILPPLDFRQVRQISLNFSPCLSCIVSLFALVSFIFTQRCLSCNIQ